MSTTHRAATDRAPVDRGAADRAPGRHDRVAIALHWLIGIALLLQITLGFLLDDIAPRGTPARAATINLHKSIGVLLGVAIVARIAWRLTHRPPAWSPGLSARQQRAARLGHRALYACMVLMPASGYIGSNFSIHGVRFFGHPWPAWGPDLPAVYRIFNTVHVATGRVFAVLIAGHVLMALKHALIDRDDIFDRIRPWAALPAPALHRPHPPAS